MGKKTADRASGRGELALIEGIRRSFQGVGQGPGKRKSVALGIGDDCAILRPTAGTEVLVTTDLLLEGRHFRRDLHPPESAGHRCLARGLSDLAAMGATPMAAFLSIALPPEILSTRSGRGWVHRFLGGLRALAERSGVPLAGGDTAEATGGVVAADIVLVGSAPVGRSLRRSGARPGDGLYVTGSLGGAAAELERMFARGGSHGAAAPAVRRWTEVGVQERHPQMFPQPRLGVGLELLRRGLSTACLDLSDGLSTDLAHLTEASDVGAEISLEVLPVHRAARARADWQKLALSGGEDYELLFTARPDARVPRVVAGTTVTRIGTVVRREAGKPAIVAVAGDGSRKELRPAGWEHFSHRSAAGL